MSRRRLAHPTDTFGAQQLSFFNTHYDNWYYLPMMGFVSFDDEPDQNLCVVMLRPGNAGAAVGAVGVLRRLIDRIRSAFWALYMALALSEPPFPFIRADFGA